MVYLCKCSRPSLYTFLSSITWINFRCILSGCFSLCHANYTKRFTIYRSFTFYSVMFGFSGIIGSLIGGRVIDILGGHFLYFALGSSALIGTICFITFYFFQMRNPKT